jgi:hypothetical protein
MFVPSLSWQNDRFYIYMAQQYRFGQAICELMDGGAQANQKTLSAERLHSIFHHYQSCWLLPSHAEDKQSK